MQLRRALLFCLLPICCGCGPTLLDDREVTMQPGEIVPIEIGPFNREKTVTVTASSPGAPISIYVHAKDQSELVDEAVSFQREPEGVFAGVASTESETLTAVVPADTTAVVRLQPVGHVNPTVQLRISN